MCLARLGAGAAAILMLTGCYVGGMTSRAPNEVRARHAGEFGCPANTVQITEYSATSLEARGCGYRAVYACTVNGFTCVRDSEATPTGGPPAQPPPQPVAQQPPPGPDPDTTIRQGLQARRDAILGCTNGISTTVVAAYDAQGTVHFSLGDALAGSDAESCVRQQLGSVRVETGGRSGAVSETIAPPAHPAGQPL